MRTTKRKYPNKDQINEYKGFIETIDSIAENMSDGAWFITLETETEVWLNEKGYSHLCPNDFLQKHYIGG
ncbi:hypothetical protein PTQ27_09060 [Mannheimia sp. AT1]|uniref:Uncharacterized protein n=1 Tax=Mannheimia cairinae TaxID=3025936 RepID=A0ABT5MQZ3_9PAST|nr:hypothetical protein [Mannheimia cairinae]MDD0824605.1 hypothetical protein [Mannheimia cairinae]MDD0826466.1 hypothetical protein [Mannheimia cairinae]